MEMLLSAGADPNAVFIGRSAWQRVVNRLIVSLERPIWLETGKVFLRYGADLEVLGADDLISSMYPQRAASKRTFKSLPFLKKAFSKFIAE